MENSQVTHGKHLENMRQALQPVWLGGWTVRCDHWIIRFTWIWQLLCLHGIDLIREVCLESESQLNGFCV